MGESLLLVWVEEREGLAETLHVLHGDLPVQAGRLAPRPRAGGGAVAVVGGVAHVGVGVAGGDISLPGVPGAVAALVVGVAGVLVLAGVGVALAAAPD